MQAKELFPSTSYIGKVTHRFSQITSTNNYAKELIAKGEPVHGTVILADYQSLGRGQTGNIWNSAPGQNLLTSIILRPKFTRLSSQFYLNKIIAISVATCISSALRKDVKVKWPNDILIHELKTAGILIENIFTGRTMQFCIVGIGLNVNQQLFATELQNVTSLHLESGKQFEVMNIASDLFQEIESTLELLQKDELAKIDELYHNMLFRRHESHLFKKEGKQFIGEIIKVDEQGQLHMLIDGAIHTFRNQEIDYVF